MAHKRQAGDIADAVDLVDLEDGWMEKVLDTDDDTLILILCELCNQGRITNKRIKADRVSLPSFSTAKWDQFASSFGLPQAPEKIDLDSSVTPVYQLPPSFHTANFESAWRAQDVYQEKVSQTREDARVRILDPYIVPILALFRGRLIDRAEQAMPESEYSTGGDVEHNVFMIGGILFFVLEMKLLPGYTSDNLAHLFLEFLSAAKLNKRRKLQASRIYGLFTDLSFFHFYSYDPVQNKFYRDENLFLDTSRALFLSGMIPVSNKIFGVILNAYIEGLQATISNTADRAPCGDYSPPGSSLLDQFKLQEQQKAGSKNEQPMSSARGKQRKSTDHWELALKLALECVDKLNEKVTSIEDMEKNSTEALVMLANSVGYVPRVSCFTGEVDPKSSDELQVMARDIVHDKLQSFFKLTHR